MDILINADRHFFKLINSAWHNDFFDWLMPWLRNSIVWAPLYIFLIVFAIANYKKSGWWWIIMGAITVGLSDFVSSTIIKNNIIRTRPCNDLSIASWTRVLVGHIPQNSSFTSSHAANHFSISMYFYLTLKPRFNKWPLIFFFWAFCISYAQIYVGVHYPLDIICGALIGILIGYLTGRLFNRKYELA